MRYNILILFTAFLLVTACFQEGIDGPTEKGSEPADYPASQEFQMQSVLYTQTAAEYRALCYQSYKMAKVALQSHILHAETDKPWAVVLDIDETVLDNSPYQATCILKGVSYPVCWDEWCMQASAGAIPGVTEFINFAKTSGVEVFFITNRKEHLREATAENLEALGLGSPDESHLLMRTDESSKEGRRQQVLADFSIGLLVGDNLADFSELFEDLDISSRMEVTDSLSQAFGEHFIMLPNTMYGDWLAAVYEHDRELSPEQMRTIRFGALRPGGCKE